MKTPTKFFVALVALATPSAFASCGSAFCMLNTNWSAQGVWLEPGMRLDLRYEYIDQNQLVQHHAEAEDHQEIGTLNHNLQATFDYAFNDRYGVSVSLPVVSREHSHYHLADGEAPELESWDFTRLGDIRLQGRMQLSSSAHLHDAYGLTLGVKLPSGDYQLANAEGEAAERSLQPGTGTTDLLWGAYYRQQLPSLKSQWFVQAAAQHALDSREGFHPGNQWQADVGYLYHLNPSWQLMTQLNYSHKASDNGINAEPENSGQSAWFLSPGVSYAVSKSVQCYGFVHHRLALAVNGGQLAAKDSYVVGASWRF